MKSVINFIGSNLYNQNVLLCYLVRIDEQHTYDDTWIKDRPNFCEEWSKTQRQEKIISLAKGVGGIISKPGTEHFHITLANPKFLSRKKDELAEEKN